MRTKALLGLAALAIGLSTSVAADVYSINVVGYVNVTLHANKLHFLSLPLKPSDGNWQINNTIQLDDSQNAAILYYWAGSSWVADPPTFYAGQPVGQGWYTFSSLNVSNPPVPCTDTVTNGQAFFLASQADSVLTFVGEVPQGTLNYVIKPGSSTLANQVPISTNFPGALVGNNADEMFTWDTSGPTYSWTSDPWFYYDGTGWSTNAADGPYDGPVLAPTEGVFYVNSGSAVSFSQTFTVQ